MAAASSLNNTPHATSNERSGCRRAPKQRSLTRRLAHLLLAKHRHTTHHDHPDSCQRPRGWGDVHEGQQQRQGHQSGARQDGQRPGHQGWCVDGVFPCCY
jgi:hypothetical protein